ncbi:MAG: PAS domain S-box protein, partial [bacterium]|nr:PAS domain S-box protein [bacterium]
EVAERRLAEEKVQEQYQEMQVYSLELEASNEELRLTQEKLRGINEYLETRVAERTIELTRVNELLEEDIAKREEIEAELREKEAKLRAMFDAIGDGVNVTDLEGNIVEVNDTFLCMFGFVGKEDVIGKNASAFVSPEDHIGLINHITDALNGVNEAREYILVDSTGRKFFGEASMTMIRDSLGNPVRFISVTRDISER